MVAPYASELDKLYAEIDRLAEMTGVGEFCPRPENRRKEDRSWIVEGPSGRFIEYYMERGRTEVVFQGDYDAMLFNIMRSAAQSRATRIEFEQRIAGQDTRRQWYEIQRDLITRMKPQWADRIAEHQASVLANHPFRDDDDLA